MTTKRLTKALINGHNSLNSAKYFAGDESKNYSVFQPLFRCFTTSSNTDRILACKRVVGAKH